MPFLTSNTDLFNEGRPSEKAYLDYFRGLIRESGPVLTNISEAVQSSSTDVVIGCSFGRDRTGLVCAVLQLQNGIPPRNIIHRERAYVRDENRCKIALEEYAGKVGTTVAELHRRDNERLNALAKLIDIDLQVYVRAGRGE